MSTNNKAKYGQTCKSDCLNPYCTKPHPNMHKSIVVYDTPCIYGYTKSCRYAACQFNHYRTELEFIKYRICDPQWADNNQDLIYRYIDELGLMSDPNNSQSDVNSYTTGVVSTYFHGCVYYDDQKCAHCGASYACEQSKQ